MGHKFIIRTEQESLKHLCQQTIQTLEQQRWLPKLLGYDFLIAYKPGKDNIATDALSRSLLDFYSVHCDILSQNLTLQATYSISTDIIQKIQAQQPIDNNYNWKHDILWYNNRIWVPNNAQVKSKLLYEFYCTPLGGHSSSLRTHARLQQ